MRRTCHRTFGNQGDALKVSRYKDEGNANTFTLNGKKMEQRIHAYYIPATYAEYAKAQGELAVLDIDETNKNLLNIKVAASNNESTR